jgi:peptide methionine sulfoxide reductase MsrA
MEEILRKIPGVLETRAGYTGGHFDNPRYEDTHDGKSGHAEAVQVSSRTPGLHQFNTTTGRRKQQIP